MKLQSTKEVNMKLLFVTALLFLVSMSSGCGLLGNSDYDSHTKARVAFKDSDDQRIAAQAEAIAAIAATPTKTEEGAGFQKAIGMFAISTLQPQEYNEAAPMTATQAGVEIVKVAAPIMTMGYSNVRIATEGLKRAGTVMIGDGATVTSSLNDTQSINLGSGVATTTGTAVPTVVDPVIVEPVIVQPVIVQ
jgi:hypothetical protein